MDVRYHLYSGLQMLLAVGGVFAAALLFAGFGRAAFPNALAERRVLAGSLALGVAVGGWFAFGRLRIGRWLAVGRRAGLEPEGSTGLVSRLGTILTGPTSVRPLPSLTGTFEGRPVRAKTYAVSTGGGDEGSGTQNYTVVEADLDGPTEMSIVLGHAEGEPGSELVDSLPGQVETAAIGNGFVVVGNGSEAYADRILTGRARSALGETADGVGVTIGNPTDTIMDALPDDMGMAASLVTGAMESVLRDQPAYDESTVATQHEGLLLDAGELQRRATTVAAIADGVERAEAETAAG